MPAVHSKIDRAMTYRPPPGKALHRAVLPAERASQITDRLRQAVFSSGVNGHTPPSGPRSAQFVRLTLVTLVSPQPQLTSSFPLIRQLRCCSGGAYACSSSR